MSLPRVLIVEDDAIQAYHLQDLLERLGYRVAGKAATGEDAIRLALESQPDAILMDINLRGELTGLDVAARIRPQMDAPVVYLTAYADDNYIQAAKNNEGFAFLVKPVRDRDLRASLEMALYKHSVEQRIQHLNQVLRAVRAVNQLINREKDPARLLNGACQILVQTRGYRAVWVCPPAGFDFSSCASQAEAEAAFHARLNAPPGGGEPLRAEQSACIPMTLNEHAYGWLCVLAEPRSPLAAAFNDEELAILTELAEDLAYGLHAIQEEAARRQAENELRAERDRFNKISATVPGLICSFHSDAQGKASMPFASAAIGELYGLSAEEVREDIAPLFARIHPADLPYIQASIAESARTMTLWRDQFRYNHPTRGERWMEGQSVPIAEPDGAITWHGFVTDITERLKSEQLLRASESRFAQAFYASPSAISIVRQRDSVFIDVNPAWEKLTGCARAEAVGENTLSLNTWEDLADRAHFIKTLEEQQIIDAFEFPLRRKSGELSYASISAVLIELDGEICILTMIEDVTARKLAEEELTQLNRNLEQRVEERTTELSAANRELEKAARVKDEFLASMSHELRTPLTGILGLSQALQYHTYGALNDKQSQAVNNIENSGRHLLDLINDVLDLSRLEAGMLELIFEPVALSEVCQSAVQLVKGMARQKNQPLDFTIAPETIFIRADGRRLKQILINLLGNAVKFSPREGRIGLDVRGDLSRKQVELAVWDHGIGINHDDLQRLFQPFVQLDSRLAREYSGSGLGLSLVLHMVEMHGGSIRVDSAPGEGSRFTIYLPWSGRLSLTGKTDSVANPNPPPTAEEDPIASSDTHILVIENNALVRDPLVSILHRAGWRVSQASGSAYLVELINEMRPDLVVLNIRLPGLGGIEALSRLRASRGPGENIPIIALTDLVLPGDRERCLAAGASAYLRKPLYLPELLDGIYALLYRRHDRKR